MTEVEGVDLSLILGVTMSWGKSLSTPKTLAKEKNPCFAKSAYALCFDEFVGGCVKRVPIKLPLHKNYTFKILDKDGHKLYEE